MQDELEPALADYLKLVNERLARRRDEATDHQGLIVLRSRAQELVSLVEEVEEGGQFAGLVQATANNFSCDPSRRDSSKWKSYVQNFFRHSGVYQDAFAGKTVDTTSIHRLYVHAFTRTEIKIEYFAPLEFISFAEEHMDFGDFQVQRFTKDELDQKFQQATCRIFHPRATIDTELLAQYWLLTCSETKLAREPGSMKVTLDFRVRPKYSNFPKAIETALKRLVLFPWGAPSQPLQPILDLSALKVWDAPASFGVPFFIAVSDSLVDHPKAMPDTASLETYPVTDPETGEYLGETPFVYTGVPKEAIKPGQRTSQDFVNFVRGVDTALKDVGGVPGWRFVDIALDFLVKAFFLEDLEQLLWHITAVEAVLGERRDQGSTKLLKKRVGLILGDSEEGIKSSAKLFGELYDFRSALVHGDKRLTNDAANLAHLSQAREFARCVTLWMLNYLHHILLNRPASAVSRDDVLVALDVNPQTRPAVAELLARLPPGFPQIREWRDV